jgi:hypothetical protein
MSQNHKNQLRTKILDLVDESSQPSVLSQSDLHLVKGGWMIIREGCSCTVGGGEDFDNTMFYFDP